MANDQPPATDDRESRERRSFFYQIAHYSHIAFVLPAAILVGWLLGGLLDKWLHTTWLYLVGVFVGIVAGFVDLIRTAVAAGKDTDS
jgi:F0F1-type ATP synthase assembly protein I